MIELININKSYYELEIFNDFNLKINEGDFVMITGSSGSGKTTLLNIIGLIENFDHGTLKVLDYTNPKLLKKSGRTLLKNNYGYLFQNFGLIDNISIYENLKISTKYNKKSKTDIIKTLKMVGINKDLDTIIYTLSGGEQQRVAIAKLMLKDADIILCDEPTGSLDKENRDIVMSILTKLHKQGKTLIMVTHDSEILSLASRVISLSKRG